MFEITCELKNDGKVPLYLQLYDYFKQEIQSGRISAHSKLPSTRRLSQHLGTSRNTIDAAYQQLLAEGYVRSAARRGLFVEKLYLYSEQAAPVVSGLTTSDNNSTTDDALHTAEFDFRQDGVDLDCIPLRAWKKLSSQTFSEEHLHLCLNGDSQGEPELRQEIADYLFQSRGVNCLPEQVVIGTGNQYLLTLLCSLIGRDKAYAVEEPGFHRARAVLENTGLECLSVPLDEHGIDITALRKSQAQVAYVTPSHQFPFGTIMPIARRRELIQWAKDTQGFIIEDDYDGEFRYLGKPIPALQGLDEGGRTLYLGTFSKALFPSMCVSYMVIPPALLADYRDKFSLYKQTVPRAQQYTLARFMQEGYWERHLNRVRNHYKKKRAFLMEVLEQEMDARLCIRSSESGLHILLAPNNGMSECELIETAAQKGVGVYPISAYYHDDIPTRSEPLILLGFGVIPTSEIEMGIRKLNAAWFG